MESQNYWDSTSQPETRQIKIKTTVIEKYNKKGEFIGKEVITVTKEKFDKTIWNPVSSGTITITSTDLEENGIYNQDNVSIDENKFSTGKNITTANGNHILSDYQAYYVN